MYPLTRILLVASLLAASASAPAAGGETPSWLERAQWQDVRRGGQVTALPALAEAVRRWAGAPESVIVLRHPGGESGTRWARSVRDWLVALGVDSDHLRLEPGTAEADRLYIEHDGGPR